VEPLITIKLETLHSNAVASRPDSHTLSLAQLSSELLIAVDSTATGLPKSAMLQNQDNSQTWQLATRLALLKLFTRSVMLLRRNVKLVKWEHRDATPEPSARPPATNHTLSAIKLQANVDLATHPQTRTAQKLKERAEQSAKSLRPNPNAITPPERAQNAKMDKVVLIPRHAQQLVLNSHQKTVLTPATGLNSHQHVKLIQREPLPRKHVLMNAR